MDILGDGQLQPLQRRLTLRDALKMEADRAPAVHKTDAFHAETVVRLFRRVEAQSMVQQPVMLAHDDMADLDAGLHGAALDAALDGAMAEAGLGGDVDLGDGLGGEHDLMSGLMAGGESSLSGDLFGGMGDGDGLGDGMFS